MTDAVTAQVQSLPQPKLSPLQTKARELESAFLAEMLKAAGVGKPLSSFNGGAGEEAFSSFLVSAYADQITRSGGIGLSEAIVRALAKDEI